MSFSKHKLPTLVIIAQRKEYNLSVLEELLNGISSTIKLPIIIITPLHLPPSFRHKYPMISTETELTNSILKKADIGLMLDGNTSKKTLAFLSEAKIVPILPQSLENHNYQNYDAVKESGNCFTFEDLNNPWAIFGAIVRAVETYQFPYDWSNLLTKVYRQ